MICSFDWCRVLARTSAGKINEEDLVENAADVLGIVLHYKSQSLVYQLGLLHLH